MNVPSAGANKGAPRGRLPELPTGTAENYGLHLSPKHRKIDASMKRARPFRPSIKAGCGPAIAASTARTKATERKHKVGAKGGHLGKSRHAAGALRLV